MNSDLIDLLQCLNANKVRYLIVGGYAVMKYTEPRFTKDIDIWVEPTTTNARRVYKALESFKAPIENITASDFSKPGTLFIMGLAPNRFDILTRIRPLKFEAAWENRVAGKLAGAKVNFISLDDLIKAKKVAARAQDLVDYENLKQARQILKPKRKKT